MRAWVRRVVAGSLALLAALVALTALRPLPAAAQAGPFVLSTTRFAGADRYDTSARLAEAAFPNGAATVVMASGANFPDALSGAFLASALGAPVLLTTPTPPLSPYTTDALAALRARRVYLLGGPAAVSDSVEAALAGLGLSVVRVYQQDGCRSTCNRYDTDASAVTVAPAGSVGTGIGGGPTAILATGANFPDALAAAPLAYAERFPIVLTDGSAPQLVPQARSMLRELGIKDLIVMGGSAVINPSILAEVESLGITVDYQAAGADRTQTAVDLADYEIAHYGFSRSRVELADGADFPDALSGAPFAAMDPAAILLTESPEVLGPYTGGFFEDAGAALTGGYVLGGPAAVFPSVVQDAEDAAAAPALRLTTAFLPPGSVGVDYRASLAATGGVAPYTWSVPSGALPPGLGLDPSSGVISGLPTQAGTTTFTAGVTDAYGRSATATLSVTIEALPILTPGPGSGSSGSPPPGSTGSLLVSIGGVPPGTTPSVAVSGPGGYVRDLAATTTLSGLAPGSYSISAGPSPVTGSASTYYASVTPSTGTVQVLAGATVQAAVSWDQVLDSAHVVSVSDASSYLSGVGSCTLPDGATGDQLDFSAPTGSVPASITSLAPGDLVALPATAQTPGGLLVQVVTVITDIPSLVQLCTDQAGLGQAAPQGSIDLAQTLVPGCVSGTLPAGSPGTGFSLSAPSGSCPYADPPGAGAQLRAGPRLSVHPGPRLLARPHQGLGGFSGSFGTGTNQGTEPGFSCGGSPPINITGGISFTPSFNLGASWSVTSGLTASVSASVTESLQVNLSAEALASCSAQIPLLADPIDLDCFDIQVGPIPVFVCPILQLYLYLSVGGGVGQPLGLGFDQTATASAGLSVSCGAFGCSSSPQSSYTNSVTTNQTGAPESSVDLKVAVGPQLLFEIEDVGGPEVDAAGFGELSVNPFAYQSSPPKPWWTLSGGLEAGAGLSLDLGGVIPVASVSDPSILSVSSVFAQAPSTEPPPPPVITATPPEISPSALPSGTVGVPYDYILSASGGAPPYTWSATSLPPGLSLNELGAAGQEWEVTGTPTQEGSFTVALTLADQISTVSGHTITQDDSLEITGPVITTTSLAPGEEGIGYSAALAAAGGVCATGGSPPCVSWSVTSGSLPPGLSLDPASGAITGTPSASGSFAFTATATDAEGNASQAPFTIVVYAPVAIYDNGTGLGTSVAPHAEAGTAYSATIGVNPYTGEGPYTWTVSAGRLPPGLALSCPGGAATCPQVDVSGTPESSDAGLEYSFTVQVGDALGGSTTQGFSVEVLSGVAITSYSLPEADAGVAYTAPVTAQGGQTPFHWTLSVQSGSGSVSGLSIASDGSSSRNATISGTAPAAGGYTATVQVTDAIPATDSLPMHLQVNPLPSITTTSLPDATIGAGYDRPLGSSGGSAPLTWSLAQGTLPAGLFLDPASGAITGTVAPGAVDETFTVRVRDRWGQSATRSLTINVPLGLTSPGGPLQDGYAGVAYSTPCGGTGADVVLGAAGGAPAYAWSVSSGSLPAGLALDPGTGEITGTPSGSGSLPSTSEFTVTVTDQKQATASQSYSVTVYPDATVISAVSPAVGGTAGGNQVTISGSGFCPGVSVAFGSVPASSVTVESDTRLSVTTPAQGAGQVSVAVTSALGSSGAGPADDFTYYTTPVITSVTMWSLGTTTPPATTCSGLGNCDPFALELTYNVPISVSPTVGLDFTLVGNPVSDGAYGTCNLDDWKGHPGNPDPVETYGDHLIFLIYFDACVADTINTNYGLSSFPVTYSVAPGTAGPGVYDTYPEVYEPPGDTGTGSFVPGQCGVGLGQPPCTVSTTLGSTPAEVGVPVSAGAVAETPVPPDYWSVTGLPPGLAQGTPTYSDSAPGCSGLCSSLAISGTPTATGTGSGTGGTIYDVELFVSDYANQFWGGTSLPPPVTVPLTVEPALSVSTTSLPAATAGAGYDQTLAAAGGVGFDTWSLASGSLPPGLSLDPFTGAIAGIPSHPVCTGAYAPPNRCTYDFGVQVSDAYGVVASASLSITVDVASLTVSRAPLPLALTGAVYDAAVGVTGGVPPYVWSLASGSGPLPPGLSLDTSSGQISGTPTAAGSYPIEVQATDSEATPVTASQSLTLEVSAGTLTLATTSLPPGSATVAYSATLAAQGGVAPYTWSATGLPSDLSLDASTGTISGTPSQADVSASPYSVDVSVTDAAGETAQATLSLAIGNAPLEISTTSVPGASACTGGSYSVDLLATGGTPPYTWSLASGSGPLPPGLSLDASGLVSGLPTRAGSYPVVVRVSDSAGASQTEDLTFTVSPTTLEVTTSSLPDAYVGHAYGAGLEEGVVLRASGGSDCSSYSWSATGLPSDLSLDASTGAITGTPSQSDLAESPYSVDVTVTDAAGQSASRSLNLVVATVPGAPTSPSASTGSGGGSVKVSWSAPSSDGGAAITAYEVYDATAGGKEDYSGSPACSAEGSATTCTVYGLTGGDTYYFTVEAVNGAGPSPPSSEVSAVASSTCAGSALADPRSQTVTSCG